MRSGLSIGCAYSCSMRNGVPPAPALLQQDNGGTIRTTHVSETTSLITKEHIARAETRLVLVLKCAQFVQHSHDLCKQRTCLLEDLPA